MNKKFGLLYEAARGEQFNSDDLAFSNDVDDIEDELDPLEELEESIHYTAEMVNVFEHVTAKGDTLMLVECSDLQRFMECNDLELGELEKAIADVAKSNGVEVNNIAIVVESSEEIEEMLQEARKVRTKSSKPMKRLKDISDLSKMATNKGIKVVKRKAKKKNKKKR